MSTSSTLQPRIQLAVAPHDDEVEEAVGENGLAKEVLVRPKVMQEIRDDGHDIAKVNDEVNVVTERHVSCGRCDTRDHSR